MIYTLRAMHSRSIPLSLHHRLSPFLSASSYNNVVARAASSLQASSSPRPPASSPALPDSPPKVTHPSSLISDTLRVAPEPPKAPRLQHQAPRIRSRKAALTLVRFVTHSLLSQVKADYIWFCCIADSYCRPTTPCSHLRPNTATHSHWCP